MPDSSTAGAAQETSASSHGPSMAIWVGLLTLAGLALRFYHLGYLPLWSDEFFTAFYIRRPIEYLIGPGRYSEPNPPVYYLIAKAWAHLFGDREFALRTPTALASGLTVPFVYLLGRELYDRRTGLVAASLFAFSSTSLYYAQEARAYAFVGFAASVHFVALAIYLNAAWAGLSSTRRAHLALAGYVASSIGLVYFHATQSLFMAASAGTGAVYLWRLGKNGRPALRSWIIAGALVVVVCIPEVITYPARSMAHSFSQPVDARLASGIVSFLLGFRVTILLCQVTLGLTLILIVACTLRQRVFDRLRTVPVLVLTVIPLVYFALLALVQLHQPILITRILIGLEVPVTVLLAALVTTSRHSWMGMGLAASLFVGYAASDYCMDFIKTKEGWRDFAASIKADSKPDDLFVFAAFSPAGAFYYYDFGPAREARQWNRKPIDEHMPEQMLWNDNGIAPIELPALAGQITSGRRVWLITKGLDTSSCDTVSKLAGIPSDRTVEADQLQGCGWHILPASSP